MYLGFQIRHQSYGAIYTHTKVISVYRIAEILPGQIFHQAQLTLRYRNIQWNKFSPMLKWTGQKKWGKNFADEIIIILLL